MAFDKSKVEKAALKFAQKGQYHKAIAEYQKIITAEPRDMRIRIKLLDLYGKTGKKAEAIEECRKVADAYVAQGFTPRAIAIWKQAVRIAPENASVHRDMGELYLQQKLIGDSISSYKQAVDLLKAEQKYSEAGELLERMEELAPDNVAIKVVLAELYLEEGDAKKFATQLEKIMVQLKGEGRARKLLTTLENLFERSGRRFELVKPLAQTYLDLGDDDHALEIIRHGLSQSPEDRDLRLFSIRANLALGNLMDAHKVAMGIREESPEDLFILEQLCAIAEALNDTDEMVTWYKEMAQVYAKQGMTAKEEYYYSRVLELVPDDAEARLAVGDLEKPLPTPDAEAELIETFNDGIEEISAEELEDAPSTPVDEGVVEAELYMRYGLDEKALEKLRELKAMAPDHQGVSAMLRDLCWKRGDRDGWLVEQLSVARHLAASGRGAEAYRAYQEILDVMPENEEAHRASEELAGAAEPVTVETEEFFAELRRVDSLIDQQETGEAVSILLRLQEEYPESQDVNSRLAELGWVAELRKDEDMEDTFADLKAELGDIQFDIGQDFAGFKEVEVGELDDILKEFKSGVAEKLGEGDFETHYDLGVAYKEMGLLEDALQEFQKAARFSEKAKNAYTSMAMIYRESAQPDDARSALRMALSVPSNSPQDRAAILYELGTLSEEQQDWQGAVNAFEKAYELDPALRDLAQRLEAAKAQV